MQRHFCFCFLFTPARDAKIQFSISVSQISSFHVCAYLNNSYYYLSNELSIQKIVSYTALWMHILIMMSVSIRVLHRYFSVLLFFLSLWCKLFSFSNYFRFQGKKSDISMVTPQLPSKKAFFVSLTIGIFMISLIFVLFKSMKVKE